MLRATPTGEDGVNAPRSPQLLDPNGVGAESERDLYQEAEDAGVDGARRDDIEQDPTSDFETPTDAEFLQMVRDCEAQASMYSNQVSRQAWERTYRAFHQQHFTGSKYKTNDFKNRSKLFIPKTRSAIRKDMAAVASSMFGSIDAVNCMPGNEADPMQKAAASVIQEVVNYRTDRSSGKAAMPWFNICMGARQTALLAGICMSKQSWKLELRKQRVEEYVDEETGQSQEREVWTPYIDRPNVDLIPPENFVIDPAADWTNPAQDSAYVIIKWPMRLDEIKRRQADPRRPWNKVSESQLKACSSSTKEDQASIRRARDRGMDRLDETQSSGREFDIIWVYETYIRCAGDDFTFISVGDKHLLTDPAPVSEVYPEQFGERPLALGYGQLEAFNIFPMSAAESWQPLQQEANDLRNLTLDAVKQSVTPVTKVVRGRQVDLDQLKRRGQGSAIMVTKHDDVTWEKVPDISNGTELMKRQIDIDFDDLSGTQNYGTVENNNALSRTLGGLKLAAGAANAVQELDIRIWIETWTEPTLSQVVRLIQYYESDPIILGLCGEKAQLMQKYGINQISDELLENQVTIRVNAGLGAGDPQQRLQKFAAAAQIAMPILAQTPKFMSGELSIDEEAVMEEVFGAAGYRDGGMRFIRKGEAKQNPMLPLEQDKIASEAEKNRATAKKSIMDGIVALAGIGLQKEAQDAGLEGDNMDRNLAILDRIMNATDMGARHGGDKNKHTLGEKQLAQRGETEKARLAAQSAKQAGGGEAAAPAAGDTPAQPQPPMQQEAQPPAPRRRKLNFERGANGRIISAEVIDL